jgi:hypothetical protein
MLTPDSSLEEGLGDLRTVNRKRIKNYKNIHSFDKFFFFSNDFF